MLNVVNAQNRIEHGTFAAAMALVAGLLASATSTVAIAQSPSHPTDNGPAQPKISFVIDEQFTCSGDRFTPVDLDPKFCPEAFEDQPSSIFLIAEGDFCQDYDGQHRLSSPQDLFAFSRGAGTSGGIIGFNVNVNGSGAISASRGPSAELSTVMIMIDAEIGNPFVDFETLPPDCFGIGSFAQADIDTTINIAEPGVVVELDTPQSVQGTLLGFAVGDIVPAGDYTLRIQLFAGFSPEFDDPGIYIIDRVASVTLRFPDCDNNGINDLLEADSDGNGTTDACEPMQNLTQGTGYANIQDAINTANPFDVIEVAPGFYRQQMNTAGKSLIITSINPNDPNVVASTVFSGDLDDNGTADVEPLLIVSNETNDTIISGLAFTDGFPGGAGIAFSEPIIANCLFFNNTAEFGAGVTVFESNPLFFGCTFEGNTAKFNGGAIDAFSNSVLTIEGAVFRNNNAGVGGAIHVFDSTAIIEDATFFQNTATLGGGVAIVAESQADIGFCTFDNNAAIVAGGGLFANTQSSVAVVQSDFVSNACSNEGGGFYADATQNISISESSFVNNVADRGGAITLNNATSNASIVDTEIEFNFARQGAGVEILAGSIADISNVNFSNNQASQSGGGLVVFESQVLVDQCVFFSNTAIAAGGGVAYALESQVITRRTTFESNAADFGAGLYAENSPSVFRVEASTFFRNNARIGGGISVRPASSVLVSDSVFTQNAAEFGGGLDVFNGSLILRSSTISLNATLNDGGGSGISTGGAIGALTARNTIIWNDTIFAGSSVQPTIEFSVIDGGFPGIGNVNADPMFENAPDNNFRLLPNSSAIDAGSNNFPTGAVLDYYNQPRFRDDTGVADTGDGAAPIIDIGAAEFQGTSPTLCLADFNTDGSVNVLDVIAFIGVWNAQGPGADYNTDGSVNVLDVIAFIGVWNAGCSSP